MNPWFSKAAVLVTLLAYVFIRGPHGRRSRAMPVAKNRKDVLEIVLLLGTTLGTTILPVVWVATGFPKRAEYPLHPVPYVLGLFTLGTGL